MASSLPRNSRNLFEMIGFRCLNVTAEVASKVSMRPQQQTAFNETVEAVFRIFNVTA
jgi:hypothetical protein